MKNQNRANATLIIFIVVILIAVFALGVFYFSDRSTTNQNTNAREAKIPNTSTAERTVPRTEQLRTQEFTPTVTQTTSIPTTEIKKRTVSQTQTQPQTSSTATVTHTPTIRATQTPPRTRTSTSSDADENITPDKYLPFIYSFAGSLKEQTEVPMTIMGVLVEDKTMWVVHDGTSPFVNDSRMRQEWQEIATAYVSAWKDYRYNNLSGARPNRLRYVEFNDSKETANDSTFFIPMSDVRAVFEGNMSANEFNSRWFRRLRDTTKFEEQKADFIASGTTNITYYPEGWNESTDTDTAGARPVPEPRLTLDRHRSGHGSRKARAVGQ